MKKRMLALVMTLAMCLSLLPVSALAAEGDKVAKIGETQYETLDAAIAAAQDGDTIELLADCTTGGITLNNKSLTIQGTGSETIAFRTKGIHAIDSDLTFKNCKIDMVISDHPGGNGATANLIDDSDLTLTGVTMTLTNDHSDTDEESGIFLYQGSNLYINGGSDITISGFKDRKTSSGIYADNSEYENQPNREIVIDGNSKLLIMQCGWHGMTVNPIDLTVKNGSSVTLTENGNESYGGGLGCYYGKLTLSNGSAMIANNNQGVGWGIFIKDLSIDSTSTLEACNNTGAGLTVGGEGTIATGAKVRLNDNGAMGLWVYKIDDPWAGDVTIEGNVDLEILRNKNRGIYNANLLTMKSGLVMNNATTSSGGGIGNMRSGTATLSDAVKLYNNHASVAGDDICSTGTITFGSVGSDWALDGAPDCTDAIDGWYVDGTNDRWSAHKKPVHVEKFTAGADITASTEKPLALKAAHGLIPLDPGDSGTENWAISKSKTATNLDKNYESKVTLSLPAASYKGDLDIAFVVDGSTSADQAELSKAASAFLDELAKLENLNVKASLTIFGGSVPLLKNTDLLDLSVSENLAAIKTELTDSSYDEKDGRSGSNLQAGVEAARTALNKDTSVAAEDKYMIILSDGAARMWINDADEAMSKAYLPSEGTTIFWNSNEDFIHRYTAEKDLRSFQAVWNAAETDVAQYGMTKSERDSATSETVASWATVGDLTNNYYTTYEAATYYAAQSIMAAKSESNIILVSYPYHENEIYGKYIESFKSWLADNGVSRYHVTEGEATQEIAATIFGGVKDELIQLVDAGSTVTDYIGNGIDNEKNTYNFDLKSDSFVLTVGNETLPCVKTDSNANTYYFGTAFETVNTDGKTYPFVVTYYPDSAEGANDEHFVLAINVPITKDAPVQLTYTVKLTNPQTSAGTYGQYDADGSKNYSGLYTNNSATLYPVDSNGDKGVPENFPKPTVSYTVSGGSGGGGGGGSVKPPVLNTKDHYGYIIGYPVDYITGETTNDQTRMPVKPEGNITRAEVATIFFRMLTDDSRNQFWSQSSEYSDVKTSDWFNNAICTLSNAGILSGYDDGTFAPNGKITRAEFATIASRFFEYKDSEGNNPFNDVDENSWYYQYILAASQMGLINGYPDGTFQPNNYITRAEAVTIVNRTLDRHPDQDHFLKDMLVWVDNMDTGKWYYADMQEATNSHEYEMKGSGDSKYENWTKMLEIRDWAAFEKAWSDANSASGGEVTK